MTDLEAERADEAIDLKSPEEQRLDALLRAKQSLQHVTIRGLSALQYCASVFDEELALRVLKEGLDVDIGA